MLPFLLNIAEVIFEVEMQYLRTKTIKKYFSKRYNNYIENLFQNSLAI
jgi:hypothetical protein